MANTAADTADQTRTSWEQTAERFDDYVAPTDHAERYQVGDAYYVPPGQTPVHRAGDRIVEFSPTDSLGAAIGVVMSNLQSET